MQRKFILLACLIGCVSSEAQQYPFEYYTPKNGLISSRVRNIFQDLKGRMFFITYGGLSIYDGTKFYNYNRSNGLANNLVNDILELSTDSFLIATNTNQLNTFVNGKISVFKTPGGISPIINSFLKSREGDIYMAADDGFFILKANQFIKIPLLDKNNKERGIFLEKMVEWNDYILILPWAESGLLLYDKKSRQLREFFTGEKILSINKALKNTIWVSTPESFKLLDSFSLKQGRISLKSLPRPYNKMLSGKTGNIYFDSEANCFVYNGSSLYKIKSNSTKLIGPEQGLKGYTVSLFEDKEGLLWIATGGNGVVKWKGTDIEMINTIEDNPLSVSILTNYGDTIWLYNNLSKEIHYIHQRDSGSYKLIVKDFYPQNIFIDGREIYVTSAKQLIRIKDKHSLRAYQNPLIINYPANVTAGNGVMDSNGALILYQNENDVKFFLGAYKNGIKFFEHPISFSSDQLLLNKGKLWVITRSNHLMKFSIHPENPDQYLVLEKDYTFKDLGFRSLAIDKADRVWIGTRHNGLYKLIFRDNKIDSIRQFTTANGLSDNFIYSLACDQFNNIWAGTQEGLDKLSFKNGQFIIGNTGRVNNLFQTISNVLTIPSGTVWAKTNEGTILKINLPGRKTKNYQPELTFTSFYVNNKISGLASWFNHQQNNFSFSVAAPSYIDESSIKYSYMLQGSSNNNWSIPGNISSFHFINLSPGKYTLTIRSDFPEGIYAPAFISHSFHIAPPWWQTWWSRIAFGVLAVGMGLMALRYYYHRKLFRQRSVLERQKAIEKERTRIATDMHDDLGAGLSRIKFLSETIGIKKQKLEPIEEDISKIRQYSHEMIEKMGEIVWALNEKNDSLSDLLAYTRAYATEYLSQNGIKCSWKLPDEYPGVVVSGETRRNIFLSIKESLHNIVKHSNADTVFITINAGSHLVFEIQDNGGGIDLENPKPFSNGLWNIQKRMNDIGGRSEIKNTDGMQLTLTIPLMK